MRKPDYNIVWEPQEGPQTALLSCEVFEVFFGGARGGGKTDGMLGDWISHADKYGSNASGLMVRRTMKQLEDTIKRSKQLYSPLGAKYNETSKTWVFPGGGELKMRYLERDEDAQNYQGHSYTRIYVEEIGTFPSPDPIFKLMATLRSGAAVPCGFRATGNPGGPGHQWVRARYIDPAPGGWRIVEEVFVDPFTNNSITRERVFIPSRVTENKYLGSDYIANLQMVGSKNLVRAWLEGDWSVIEGAFFPEFSEARHVVLPFRIPEDWLRFRSMDWGSASPFSVGWWAVASEDHQLGNAGLNNPRRIIPRGALVRYREWYGASKPNVGLKLTAEEVADGIRLREASDPHISYGVLDPAAFAVDGGPSIAERMAKRQIYFRGADNKRIASRGALGGWDALRARLKGDEHPGIFFFDTCVDSIRTLPALQHDPDRMEDVDTEGEDHAPDEIRYACMSRPYARSSSGYSTYQLPSPRGPVDVKAFPVRQPTLENLWSEAERNYPRRTRI